MACLDENELAAYLARVLPDAELARVEAHLAACEPCRALVEEIAELDRDAIDPALAPTVAADPVAQVEARLARGTSVGRYVILRSLGEGGFGIVYAAHDPTLDRTVALKLLRTGAPTRKDDLLREAMAMAKVPHPHVVTVHDAGEIDGRVFIAMELFDGEDVRTWLRAAKRGSRDVLRVFADAARGLAAAHAAGIVHRDFKPANVLLRRDGHVAVTDFGLARGLRDDASGPRTSTAIAGTPAYMAPEQLRGEAATPASDQFAFSVALFEALTGEHPFADPGTDVRALIEAVATGRRRGTERSLAPRVRRALDRGMAHDASDRYPSMTDLALALAPVPAHRRGRRRWTAVLVTAATIATIALAADWHERRENLCRGGTTRMSELWNETVRADVERAFAASGAPFAAEARERFAKHLDDYTVRWAGLYTDACVATRIRGVQSEDALDARAACLERARVELRTVIDDARAGTTVESSPPLRDLSECEDTASLLAQVRPPPAARAEVAAVRATLAEAEARLGLGQVARAESLVGDSHRRALALDHAPLLAETSIARGTGAARRGDHDAATKALEEALRAASRGRHDRAAAEASVELVYVAGVLRGKPEIGIALEPAAMAALARIGSNARLAAHLASTSGLLRASAGEVRFADALTEHRRAVRLYAEAGGADAPEIGPELAHVAEMLAELGRWDDSAAEAERARARIAASFGEHHPIGALALGLLARRACARGDAPACETLANRAIGLRTTRSTRPDDPTFLPMLLVHAKAMSLARNFDAARTDLTRARAIADAAFGRESAWSALVGLAISDAVLARGEAELARTTYLETIRLLVATEGPGRPDEATARVGLATALTQLARPSEALAELDEAQRIVVQRFGADSALLVAPLAARSRTLAGAGRREDAASAAARAIALARGGDTVESRAAQQELDELRR